MKKITKAAAFTLMLILTVSLVVPLTACGDVETTVAATTETTAATTEASTAVQAEIDNTEFVNTVPLTDDSSTLTAWRAWTSTFYEDPNEITANKLYEELTNVHIEWTCASTTSSQEQFNIMIVSQEYNDMIWVGSPQPSYTGGIDKAIADDVFIDVKDYMHLATNFSGYYYSNDTIRKALTTDGGAIHFSNVQSGEQPAWCGPMARTDWIKELGMDRMEIKTYDDWYEMLTGFKDLGYSNALSIGNTGYETNCHGLTGGFGCIPSFYNKDGVVTFGAIEEGFKSYLETMNKWYSEDLIDSDFFIRDSRDKQTLFTQDKLGATDFGSYTSSQAWPEAHAGDVTWEAVPIPTVDGSMSHFRRKNPLAGATPIFVTTAAVKNGNVETAIRWVDYRYSDEGAFILNYGQEGVHWTMGSDGIPHFTDEYLHNPEYSVTDMGSLHTDNRNSGYYMWIREYDMYPEEVIEQQDVWMASGTGDWNLSGVSLTTEEGNEYSAIFGDIQTFMDESIVAFIVGNKPLSEWDSYVQQIKDMNIDRCVEIYQQALDRYEAR